MCKAHTLKETKVSLYTKTAIALKKNYKIAKIYLTNMCNAHIIKALKVFLLIKWIFKNIYTRFAFKEFNEKR